MIKSYDGSETCIHGKAYDEPCMLCHLIVEEISEVAEVQEIPGDAPRIYEDEGEEG